MFLRIFFLLAFLACEFAIDEPSVLQSRYEARPTDLLQDGGIRQTKLNECLIEIHNTLDPNNGLFGLSNLCLPRSQISWLFPAQPVTKMVAETPPDLKVALLFDTSHSLEKQDAKMERFGAMETYLQTLFNAHKDGKIGDVDIRLYPFKYCDQGGEHRLIITANTTQEGFSAAVNTVIGKDKSKGNEGGTSGIGQKRDNLRAYGARGSTNYLHSFARAKKFLDVATTDGVEKHLLIFSDGLPLTFNDGKTEVIDVSDPLCKIDFGTKRSIDSWLEGLTNPENTWLAKDGIKYPVLNSYRSGIGRCIKHDLFHPQNACKRPTSSDTGLSGTMLAYNDPLNHVLGMIQHKHVIDTHRGNIKIASVHLNSCLNRPDSLNFDEEFLCQKISPLFFRSFSEDGWYFPVAEAKDLEKTFEEVASEQIAMVYGRGEATVGGVVIDQETAVYGDGGGTTRIKVDGKESEGKGKSSSGEIVTHNYDPTYSHNGKKTGSASGSLLVAQKVANWKDDARFQIDFNLTFMDQCRAEDKAWHQVDVAVAQREFGVTQEVEIQQYGGGDNEGYTAWCVVPPLPQATHTNVEGKVEPKLEEVVTSVKKPSTELISNPPGKGTNVSQTDTNLVIHPPAQNDGGPGISPGTQNDGGPVDNPEAQNYGEQPYNPPGNVLIEPDKGKTDIDGVEVPEQPTSPIRIEKTIVYGDHEYF